MQLLNIELAHDRSIATTPPTALRANKHSSAHQAGEGNAAGKLENTDTPGAAERDHQLGEDKEEHEDNVGKESSRSAYSTQFVHTARSQLQPTSSQLGHAQSNSDSGDEYHDADSSRNGGDTRGADNLDDDDEPVTGRLIDQETRKIERQLQLQRAQQRRAKEARLQRAKVCGAPVSSVVTQRCVHVACTRVAPLFADETADSQRTL